MARLAWQNVEAPNLAPAMQGFKNVTDLLDKALASTQGSVEDQLKLRKYQDDVLKARNDKDMANAERELAIRISKMSPAELKLAQANGSILGTDPESLSATAIKGIAPEYRNVYEQQQRELTDTKNFAVDSAVGLALAGGGTGNQQLNTARQAAFDANFTPEYLASLHERMRVAGINSLDPIEQQLVEATSTGGGNGKPSSSNTGSVSNSPAVATIDNYTIGSNVNSSPAAVALNNAVSPTVANNTGIEIPALSPEIGTQLQNQEQSLGLPAGMMRSIIMQETSGNAEYFKDPTKYHYEIGTDGKRKSTAFGPFGILESTARDPGYGVKPLAADKNLADQARFASEYLAARIKAAGGNVEKGLAGYGEGVEYANKVLASTTPANVAIQQASNAPYTGPQVNNVAERVRQAIAQQNADNPLVQNFPALRDSTKPFNDVVNDFVNNSPFFGEGEDDKKGTAKKNAARTIQDIQKRARDLGVGGISAELAATMADLAFGEEWFTIESIGDRNLNDGKLDELLKSTNTKGGLADQSAAYASSTEALAKLHSANQNVTDAINNLNHVKKYNVDNPYGGKTISKADDLLKRALSTRDEVARALENHPGFQPKEVTTSTVTTEEPTGKSTIETLSNLIRNPNAAPGISTRPELVVGTGDRKINLAAANEFVRTGKHPTDATVASPVPVNPASNAIRQAVTPIAIPSASAPGALPSYALNSGSVPPVTGNPTTDTNAALTSGDKVTPAIAESLSVTNPADVKPVAAPIPVPVKVDGKSGTGTTFALDSKTGQAVPVTPLKLDPNVKYEKPVTVVKADRSGGQKGVITYVGDGDGANIDVGGSTIKCRLDTFDAPETGGSPKKWPDQPYSREAENKLKSLIASGEVTVIVSKPADTSSPPSGKNNYGRSLCKIEVQGVNVDQEMLRSGAAWLRLEYATDEKLINLFNTAKSSKTGLFADPNAVPPWEYRNSFK